ncbi:MAG TPA: hypothetical protein VGH65_03370 [Verrucomicrobiaceae bacterium]
MPDPPKERWSSRIGVIMAVAGSSVGLGNFLRFPGLAAQYGGGAFMLAYVISFLLLGLPCGWMEWAMGRAAGLRGFNSGPAAFGILGRHPLAKFAGVIAIVVPVVIFFYYIAIEGWCLGYAWNFLWQSLPIHDAADAKAYFDRFTGNAGDGSAIMFSVHSALPWLALVFVLNFWLIYRGLCGGIELACNWGMPALILLALVVLARVLTLGSPDSARPNDSVKNGLGFMWNPAKVVLEKQEQGRWKEERSLVGPAMIDEAKSSIAGDLTRRVREVPVMEQLAKPDLWLAAAGQIFFSLGVGFGILLVYASYLGKKDDLVLSGLTASAANEFCEVALGGLITIPAGVAFLGVAGVAGQGTFELGFKVLPLVFQRMPLGWLFGSLFFFMLFLAALTSSIAMIQPGIAFFEEALRIGRKASVGLLAAICTLGAGFVAWFSGNGLKALDTLDFWIGTCLIFILATMQTIIFGWVWGTENGWKALHEGAALRLPRWFIPVFRWIAPTFLLTIFAFWLLINVFGVSFSGAPAEWSSYVKDLFEKPNAVAWLSLGLAAALTVLLVLIVKRSPTYKHLQKLDREGSRS